MEREAADVRMAWVETSGGSKGVVGGQQWRNFREIEWMGESGGVVAK